METPNKQSPESLLHSRPISDTLADAKLFVNRKEELDTAIHAINGRYNTIIIGPRGIGKTSLLYRIKSLAEDLPVIPVFCDISAFNARIDTFLEILIYSLTVSLQDKIPSTLKRTVLNLASELGIKFFGTSLSLRKEEEIEWIDAKYRTMNDFTEVVKEISSAGFQIVFFIDNMSLDPTFFTEVFGRFRDFLWQLDSSFIVTCDKKVTLAIWKPPTSSFFDITITLDGLTEKSLAKMLTVRGFKNNDVMHNIFTLSKGSPYIALLIARNLAMQQITITDIKQAANIQTHVVEKLTASEKSVFDQILLRDFVSASDEDFQRSTGQKRPRLVQILKKLKSLGLLTKVQRGRSVYYRVNTIIFPVQKEVEL